MPRDGNFDKSFKLSKLGRGKVQQLGSYIKKVHSSATGHAGFICAFVLAGGFKALLAGGAGGRRTGNWASTVEHTRTHLL